MKAGTKTSLKYDIKTRHSMLVSQRNLAGAENLKAMKKGGLPKDASLVEVDSSWRET